MKRTARILGFLLLCLLVLYNFTILWRFIPVFLNNTTSWKELSPHLYETHTLHRPHVEKYAIIINPDDDGRLDELGGPDHWYLYSHSNQTTFLSFISTLLFARHMLCIT